MSSNYHPYSSFQKYMILLPQYQSVLLGGSVHTCSQVID